MSRIVHVFRFVPHGGLRPEHLTSGTRGVTGSEQALISFAEASAAAGHRVVVYVPTGEPFLHKGVWYMDIESGWPRLPELDEADAVVAWLSADPLISMPKSVFRVMVFQINDWSMSYLGDRDFSYVDRFIAQSNSHRNWLFSLGGAPNAKDRCEVINNGIWMNRYDVNPQRIPHRLITCSSPDRGLHVLLHLWPEIRLKVPDATLHIFYEVRKWIEGSQATMSEIGQRARYIRDRLNRLEGHGVYLHNAVPPMTLAKEISKSDFYVYPCFTVSFTEGYCHPPGSHILTQVGEKPIESLSLSDRVLTHKGRWMPIDSVSRREFDGELVRISPYSGEPTEFTPEHPILAHPPAPRGGALDVLSFRWTPADKIGVGWYLYSPSYHILSKAEVTVSIPKCYRHAPLHSPFGDEAVHLPNSIPVTPELCRAIGYFAGDGSATKRGRKFLSIFFGSNEPKEMDDCEWCFVSTFGIKPTRVDFSPHKKMFSLRWNHSGLSYAFASWCYDASHNKMLPLWCMDLDTDYVKQLLIGLWRTDGSVCSLKRGARIATFTSASLPLISQVRLLLGRLGYRIAIKTRIHKSGSLSYYLQFSIAGEFLDYPSVQKRGDCTMHGRATSDGQRAIIVRKVERRPYHGPVLYLGVEEDKSYQIGNFSAHNSCSTAEALAAGTVPIITDMDALGELYGQSGAVVIPVGDRRTTWMDVYRDKLIEMLTTGRVSDEPDLSLEDRRLKCRRFAEAHDYSILGAKFNRMIEDGVKSKKREAKDHGDETVRAQETLLP